MDAGTIASLATAGGTLVLAIATFSSTRSANRAARISEQALRIGLRPVLFNARPQDPPQEVGFGDAHWVRLRDGLAVVQEHEQKLYFAVALRNVGAGLGVLNAWYLWPRRAGFADDPVSVDEYRRQSRDLYVPAGDVSFWQAAIRDPEDVLYEPVREAMRAGTGVTLDLLYSDHEGGQRTITRFYLAPRTDPGDEESWMWICSLSRHWNLDRSGPARLSSMESSEGSRHGA